MKNLSLILSNDTLTKKQILEIAEQEAAAIVDAGDSNLLPLALNLKKAQDYLDTFSKTIKRSTLEEAQSYGNKGFKAFGARFDVKEVGSRWNYANCQDPIYNELVEQEKQLAEKRKEREKFLQGVKGHIDLLLDGGEVATVYAPVKTSETGYSISY